MVCITVPPLVPSSDLRHFITYNLLCVHISPARAGPSIFFISPPSISQTSRCVSNGPHPADKRAVVVLITAANFLKYSFIYLVGSYLRVVHCIPIWQLVNIGI